ncbi:DUF4157 domain-containing protein [Arthrobacter jiangjiafuii]|uniref:DUF4157 domain-containing protein n=1 Tax=Arthrobacter jiangjiafuii TaxID=2817475 RepID=A0A975M7P8_9MICC|nr:DUF4157 domain-containing protein [Arthrobacter jiangjiafuii]MBP3042895.1 DUF4157 domain-containing protein [Arthrobacter jiangjiafuii]QWC11427.1 DUF4157 domain-containing protein [Arthrobacter jiangjiafuii]
MIIQADGLTLTPQQRKDIEAGLIAMGDPEGTIVATTDFDQAVRTRTGLKKYSSDRGSGAVAAKTVGDHVIINASVLDAQGHGGLERLVAHESGHVVMNSREENGRNYHYLASTQWQWEVIGLAVKGMEEYRIERKLTELGFAPASAAGLDYWDDVLYDTNATLAESVLKDQSVDALTAQIIGGADLLVTTLAYSIGALRNSPNPFNAEELPKYGRQNWDDFVAPTWAQRIKLYESLPVCTEPVAPSAWETKIKEAWSLEQALLESFGWTLSGNGQDQPESFMRTGSDDLFRHRIARLQLQDAEV